MAPFWHGPDAHGDRITPDDPEPDPDPPPTGSTADPLPPGEHPNGPTPVPEYPGLQKH